MPLFCKLSTENHWCCVISVHDGVCSVSHPAWGGGCLCSQSHLSHCIHSRESTPKACKRHTPLSLLRDPDSAQIHDGGGGGLGGIKPPRSVEMEYAVFDVQTFMYMYSIIQHAILSYQRSRRADLTECIVKCQWIYSWMLTDGNRMFVCVWAER